ncbi:MAG: YcxB family protein [Planctomycetes bacterium]|nr:YcxB family protein [Planctomycetota bacterium]
MTVEDHLDFNLFHYLKHSRSFRRYHSRQRLLFPGVMILAVFLLGKRMRWRRASRLALIIVLLIGAIWMLAYPWYLRRVIARKVQDFFRKPENHTKLGEQWVSIGPGGIRQLNEFGERRVEWHGIAEIIPTAKHVFLYYSSIEALLIPRRAFPDESSWEAFLDTVRKYHEEATNYH